MRRKIKELILSFSLSLTLQIIINERILVLEPSNKFSDFVFKLKETVRFFFFQNIKVFNNNNNKQTKL
jgi:virulence-associated protein VagC